MLQTQAIKRLDAPVTHAYTDATPPPLTGLTGVGISIANVDATGTMTVTLYHSTENDTDVTVINIPPNTAYENNFRSFRGILATGSTSYNLHIKEIVI